MRDRHRQRQAVIAAVLVLGLTACGGETADSGTSGGSLPAPMGTSEPAVETQAHQTADTTELTAVRARLRSEGSVLGAAYLDYAGGTEPEEDGTDWLRGSPYLMDMPFLADSPVVEGEGSEWYALIPAGAEDCIRIWRADLAEDGTIHPAEDVPSYEGGPGEPVLLRCNVSDLWSNVLIETAGQTFQPFLSLKDGRLDMGPEVCDLTRYEDGPDGGTAG